MRQHIEMWKTNKVYRLVVSMMIVGMVAIAFGVVLLPIDIRTIVSAIMLVFGSALFSNALGIVKIAEMHRKYIEAK